MITIELTREDERIFDFRHDSMDAQWLYQDAQARDYDLMLRMMRSRIRD